MKHVGVSHRAFMTGNRSDATGNPLSDMLDRLRDLDRHAGEQAAEAAPETDSWETLSQQSEWEGWAGQSWSRESWQSSSSSSSQWHQGWQQQSQWWKRRQPGRIYSPAAVQAWHEQQAKATATTKSEARATKRARQKQKQAALGVDVTQLNMGKAHFTDTRTAQRLRTMLST